MVGASGVRDSVTIPATPRTIAGIIDGQRTTQLQVLVASVCGGVAFCDSYGIQAVNYAGPSLRDMLALSPAQLGLVFSLGLFGMMLGGLAVGPLSDRFGRRWPMIAFTFAFGALTFATAAVDAAWELLVLRFLAGMALGAALPNAYVLAAEYSPARNRRLTIALLMAGYTGGGLVAGLLAAPLIAHFGWRSVFLVGGAAAAVTAALAVALVPESMAILLHRPSAGPQLRRILSRIAPDATDDLASLAAASSVRLTAGPSLAVLFSPAYRWMTVGLWAIAFAVMLVVYLYLSWTPVIVHDSGVSIGDAVIVTAMFNLGTVASAIGAGWLMDRLEPAGVMVGFLLFGGLALFGMGLAPKDPALLKVTSCAIGLGLGGALGGMNLLATTLYPPEARVTGSGWAISIGRMGSVIGPAIGAAWMSGKGAGSSIYLGLTPLILLVVVVCLWLRRDLNRAGEFSHSEGRANG